MYFKILFGEQDIIWTNSHFDKSKEINIIINVRLFWDA